MKKIFFLFCLPFAVFFFLSCGRSDGKTNVYEKGMDAMKNKRYEQAIVCFKEAADKEKDKNMKASALYNAGLCYASLNDSDKEIEYYKKALQEEDTYQPALYDLGMRYKEKGKSDSSLEMFERLMKVNPDKGEAYYSLAELYDEKGNARMASRYYKMASKYGHLKAQKIVSKN